MNEADIILSSAHEPTFEEISNSIAGPGAELWRELNTFIQQEWKASPKIAFSRCSGKPGWNVKYQKSGKSLCTLYPEDRGFIALVVITLALVPGVMAQEAEFTPYVIDLVASGKPYNGTLWLMIQVTDGQVLEDVKRLFMMKQKGTAT